MTRDRSIGVDRSNGSWLGVVFEDSTYMETKVKSDIQGFIDEYQEIERLVVDIPIGLFQRGDRSDEQEELVRKCDAMARTTLGRRHPSVFNPPARDAIADKIEGKSYESVKQTNEEITGKGLQKQAYHIADAIFEVDQFLQERNELEDESDGPSVVEAHPEVCFRALNGSELSYSKDSAPGFAERLQAMERCLEQPRETLYQICAELLDEGQAKDEVDVDIDDALDALVLAVVATATESELQRLPSNDPPEDAHGLPKQMVYRAEESLTVDSD